MYFKHMYLLACVHVNIQYAIEADWSSMVIWTTPSFDENIYVAYLSTDIFYLMRISV